MASPVVAGAVALLASVVPAARRWEMVNPASMKQVLLEGAEPTGSAGGMFEEGIRRSKDLLSDYILARVPPGPEDDTFASTACER